jgi:hypothetical protein
METQVNPSVISVVLIAMAAASLFVMLSLNQINYLVHGDLYDYGLQFSYRWAMPYWVFSGIVFGLSWVNIFIATLITLYVVKKRRTQPAGQIHATAAAEPAHALVDDDMQRKISEFFAPEDVPHPAEEAPDTPSEGLIEPMAPPQVAVEPAGARGAANGRFRGVQDHDPPPGEQT